MENVVTLGAPEPAEARHVLRELWRLHSARQIELAAATVLGRRDDGRSFALEQPADEPSLPGARDPVSQLLAGPFGLVLGHAPDALVGSLVDVADPRRSDQLLRCFGDALPPGSVVTVALVTEDDPAAIDELAWRLGATVHRWSRDEVEGAMACPEEPERRHRLGHWVRGVRDGVRANR